MSESVYTEWLRRYSPELNVSEALVGIRSRFSELTRQEAPSLEVRLASLEELHEIWAGFVIQTARDEEVQRLPDELVLERILEAAEFLRLAILVNNIELESIANPEGEGT